MDEMLKNLSPDIISHRSLGHLYPIRKPYECRKSFNHRSFSTAYQRRHMGTSP